MQAEGECLQNCLRHGHRLDHAGPDDLKDAALWSLRRAEDAVSIALAQVDEGGRLEEFKGPYNNQVSGTGYRQLQALRHYLVMYGATLTFDEDDVLVGEDGTTYRPDKAPKELRDVIEVKRAAARAESEARWAAMRAENDRMASEIRARRLQASARARVNTDEPVIEATRERDDEGFWRLVLRDPGSNETESLQLVIMADEPEHPDLSRVSGRTTIVRRYRNDDGTWRLLVNSRVSPSGIVHRCIFPAEGETAPAPVEQAPNTELQAMEQAINAGVIPRGAIPVPTPRYQIGPGQVFMSWNGDPLHEVRLERSERPVRRELAFNTDHTVRLTMRQLAGLELAIGNPAPDTSTPRGRTEAAMQRRQAQLADRRWVQENLREQRRARR